MFSGSDNIPFLTGAIVAGLDLHRIEFSLESPDVGSTKRHCQRACHQSLEADSTARVEF